MNDAEKGAPLASPTDRLEYMADMILELCEMARDQQLETLAGILDVARGEALLRARSLAATMRPGAQYKSAGSDG